MSGSTPRWPRGPRSAIRAGRRTSRTLARRFHHRRAGSDPRVVLFPLGASTIAFGKAPYKSVCMHGFALDAEGKKMSKSLGNVVNPTDVIEKVGVDVLRLYVLSSSAPWDDLKFNWEGVGTINRAVNILWNVYRFPLPYMILDRFAPASKDGVWDDAYVRAHLRQMPDEDRFIISRINSVATLVDAAMKECQLHRATRELVNFILEDLSRWYVQLVRPRMWLEGESEQKVFAYETIDYYHAPWLSQLLAPFCPHITEEIYQNLRSGTTREASTSSTGTPESRCSWTGHSKRQSGSSARSTRHAPMPARPANGSSAGRSPRWS